MTGLIDELVLRAVAGDEAALTGLLEVHGLEVRGALERSYRRRLSGEVDLDDVMQVTYLEAFLRIRGFVPAGPEAFRAWLKRIAENNIRDAIRKTNGVGHARGLGMPSPDGSLDRGGVDSVACTSSPSQTARNDDASRLLEDALQQLPDDYERVLRLYDLNGLSGPEVARVMGRSHGAVKMLVARARDRLGELLGSASKYFPRNA